MVDGNPRQYDYVTGHQLLVVERAGRGLRHGHRRGRPNMDEGKVRVIASRRHLVKQMVLTCAIANGGSRWLGLMGSTVPQTQAILSFDCRRGTHCWVSGSAGRCRREPAFTSAKTPETPRTPAERA